jgi:hypothetical protein
MQLKYTKYIKIEIFKLIMWYLSIYKMHILVSKYLYLFCYIIILM